MVGASIILAPHQAQAALPDTLNYQGRLTSGGAPVPDSDGNTVSFKLCTDAACTGSVWSEDWDNSTAYVHTKNGLFSVVLGSHASLAAVPFDSQYFLEVTWTNLSGTPEILLPRQPLTNAPYAFRAKYADSIGLPISGTANVFGSAVYAQNTQSSSNAVYGVGTNYGNGVGVRGEGFYGVIGSSSGSGAGVLAEQGSGTYALDVSGAARFSGGNVDFSGATVTGLSFNVPNPLVLANSLGGPVLTVTNTGGGAGVSVTVQSFSSPAVWAVNTTGNAIYGRNANPGGMDPGILGEAVYVNTVGVRGKNLANGGLGELGSMQAGVYGSSINGSGVLGSVTTTTEGVKGYAMNGTGVNGQGLTGVAGLAWSSSSLGVLASDNGYPAATALRVKGQGVFEGNASFLGGANFNSGTVDFTGSTVTGLAMGLTAPISLTGTSAASTIFANNNSSGEGLYGYAAIAAGVRGESVTGPGVQGYSPSAAGVSGTSSSGYGIYARSLANSAVYASSSAASQGAVEAYGMGGGPGVQAQGFVGVVGMANSAGGYGVFASQGSGSYALYVSGSARLGYPGGGSVITFQPGNAVNFTGTTVTGLPGVSAPLALTSSTLATTLYASNTAGGTALFASATQTAGGVGLRAEGQAYGISASAGSASAYGIYAVQPFVSGSGYAIFGEKNSGPEAAVRGVNNGATGNSVGVEGISFGNNGQAVRGESKASGNAGYGVYGLNTGSPNTGAGVYGQDDATSGYGVWGSNVNGVAVRGRGKTGVSGEANGGTGSIGVLADWNSQPTSYALKVSGPARFDMGSVTFASHVDFSGATITGLSLGVTAPLNLTNTGVQATISAFNTNGGGVALYGNDGFYGGIGVQAVSSLGTALKVDGTSIFNGSVGFNGPVTFTAGLSPLTITANSLSQAAMIVSQTAGGGTAVRIDSSGTGTALELNTGINGVGLLAKAPSFGLGYSLVSEGDARFNGSTAFYGQVTFVAGLRPLTITSSSLSQAAMIVSQTASGGTAARIDSTGTGTALELNTGMNGIGLLAKAPNFGIGYSLVSEGDARFNGSTAYYGQVTFVAGLRPLTITSSSLSQAAMIVSQTASGGTAARIDSTGTGTALELNTGMNGIGLLAKAPNFGLGYSLVSEGDARFNAVSRYYGSVSVLASALYTTSSAVAFKGTVDFAGATITGLSLNIPTPLALTSTSALSTISGTNSGLGAGGSFTGLTGAVVVGQGIGLSVSASNSNGQAIAALASDGNAIYGANFGLGGFKATALFDAQNTNHGVEGHNSTYGAYGYLGGEAKNGFTGVHGLTVNSSGKGVWGQNVSGTAVLGEGAIGIYGRVTLTGQTAVRADMGGITTGTKALWVSGNSLFDGVGNTTTFQSGHTVNLTGVTVLGLSVAAALPISGSANVAYPGGAIQASNTGTGSGVVGWATAPGANGGSLSVGSTLTAGINGYSSASISAGVVGRNVGSDPASAGVIGMAAAGTGVYGVSEGFANMGGTFEAINGIGAQGRGVTGVAARGVTVGALALYAKAYNFNDQALAAEGYATFNANSNGAALGVTQSSSVYGAGALEAFSSASGTAAVKGFNSNSSALVQNGIPGIGVWGQGSAGVVGLTTSNDGFGVLGSASGTSLSAGVRAENKAYGFAIDADSTSGTAVYARGVTGVAAYAYSGGGPAIYASGNGGSLALDVDGDVRVNKPFSSSNTKFNGWVDFSGATVTGLAGGGSVPNPLFLSGTSATVIEGMNNTAFGTGVRGQAWGVSGTGVEAIAGVAGATALRVNGLNGANGVYVNVTNGATGLSLYNGGYGDGINASSYGNAIRAYGNTNSAIALGAYNFWGGRALEVQGGSYFMGGTTFTGTVDFTGAMVTGLSGGAGVSPPVSWSAGVFQPILTLENYGSGLALSATAMNTTAIEARTTYGQYAITGENTYMFGQPIGILGKAVNSATSGIGVVGFGGLTSTSLGSVRTGVYGVGADTGVTGSNDSFPTGAPAPAGVYGFNSSTQPGAAGVIGWNNAFNGTGVYGQGNYTGLTGVALDSTQGVGVYGRGRMGGVFEGSDSWLSFNNAIGVSATGRSMVASNGQATGALLHADASGSGSQALGADISADASSGNATGLHVRANGSFNNRGLVVEANNGQVASLSGTGGSSKGLAISADMEGISVTATMLGGVGLRVSATTAAILESTANYSFANVQALSVSAQNFGWTGSATGAAFQAFTPPFNNGFATGLIASAMGDKEARGIIGIADHSNVSGFSIGVFGQGRSAGVYGRVTGSPGAGVVGEGYAVGVSAVALNDFSGNSRVGIYAMGRPAGIFDSTDWDSFRPMLGISVNARNYNSGAMVPGAIGLSVSAQSDSTGATATGIQVSAVGAYNFMAGVETAGIRASADDTTNNIAYGVVGELKNGLLAGAGIQGATSKVGVPGGRPAAGVSAVNRSTAITPGLPATALDIDGGIVMVTSRTDPSAGVMTVPLAITTNMGGGVWGGGAGGNVVNSKQIMANSIVILTVNDTGNSYNNFTVMSARVTNLVNGSFTFSVSGHSNGSFSNFVQVHWLVINQR